MAKIDSINNTPAASFGVEVDSAGKVTLFVMGEINVTIAEQVAGKLLQLAYAVRSEAREVAMAA